VFICWLKQSRNFIVLSCPFNYGNMLISCDDVIEKLKSYFM
jgi:hypothetical protein